MKDEQQSAHSDVSLSGTGSQPDPAVLAVQIKSLVADSQGIIPTPGRSPLFQVAEQLETLHLPPRTSPAEEITREIFAQVRNQALRDQTKRQTNQPISPKRQKANTMSKITILLVEDHTVFRECFRRMLEAEANMEVICEAQQGRQAVALARELHPDLVLMDISMPLLNGFEATRQIHRHCPDTKVVIMSGHMDALYIQNAQKCGAQGFVFKQDSFNNIRQAIQQVLTGKAPFVSTAGNHLDLPALAPAAKSRAGAGPCHLTSREMEVLQLIAEGKANKQTASELEISSKTVEKHRHNLMAKLNIHDTASLTRHAIELGLIEPPIPIGIS